MKMLLAIFGLFIIVCSCGPSKQTTSTQDVSELRGSWQLNYISGPRVSFDGLYPDQKPVLTFETGKNKVEGSTSCNSFTGAFTAGGKKIKIEDNLTLTKTPCSGDGESVFLQALKKINGYDVTAGHLLTLTMDNVAMMRFTKVAESF